MTTSSPIQRFHFIDLLRGWAVIMMIETHAVNAYMDTLLRQQNWFWYVNFMNGLIAPSFIFISGFALRIVSERKWDQYIAWTPIYRKQLRRLFFIWVLAYTMHLPFALLKDWTITMPEGITPLFRIDVLHVISTSMISILLLMLLLKNQRRVVASSIGLGLLVAFAAPFTWQQDLTTTLGAFIGNYFNGRAGSLFPFFPWAAFTYFGYAIADVFLRASMQEKARIFMRRCTAISFATIVIALGLYFLPIHIFPEYKFWLTSPSWLFVRVALVCLLLALMWYYEHNLSHGRYSVVGLFGKQSLLVYVLHLAMIYGTFGLPKLSWSNYHHLSFLEAMATAGYILLVMFLIVYGWQRPKQERKKFKWYFVAAALLWIVGTLFWERAVDCISPPPTPVASCNVVIEQHSL